MDSSINNTPQQLQYVENFLINIAKVDYSAKLLVNIDKERTIDCGSGRKR